MLSRSNRLPRAGFEQMAGLRRAASTHFSLSFAEQAPLSGGAVIVSKKVAKRSVDRHLLKRRVKAIMKPWLVPGRVLIIHVRTGTSALPFSELEAELAALLRQSFTSSTI